MATRAVIEFAQRLETDGALRRELEGVTGSDKDAALAAMARVASHAGFEVSPDELAAGFTEFASGELGADELDAVVGGVAGTSHATSSAFVGTVLKVVPGAIPHGGFIDPCW
jgi:hypothetical protein